ncbi:MAG: VOC family protein [Chloroflexi bacterium]|nr:MAG: VOC family protein [Chloroflexota bacterium]
MTDTVRPCITFKDRAEEAVKLYVSLFPNSKVTNLVRVEADGGPIPKGKTQAEVDKYWSSLIANGGEEGPCGWLKDRFGVSWQIVPEALGRMLSDPKSGNAEACMNAMLKMKKLDIATLEKAYKGAPVA